MNAPVRQTAAFPEVAIIRKGTPKRKGKDREGREIWIQGKDLKNKFRIQFLPGTGETEPTTDPQTGKNKHSPRSAFHAKHRGDYVEYGPEFAIRDGYEVKELRCMIPFADAFAGWEWANEAYNAGRRIAWADDDHYIEKRDPLNGEYVIRGGDPVLKFCIGDTIQYERKGKKYSIPVKFHGRLRVFLPEIEQFASFTLKTTSFYDRTTIEANLGALQSVAFVNNGVSGGIPFWLYRAEKDVTWNHDDGTASRTKIWSVFLRIDEEWVKAAMRRMSNFALTGDAIAGLLQPSEPEIKGPVNPETETFDDDETVDTTMTEEPEEPKSKAVPHPDAIPVRPNVRPYPAEVVKERIQAKAKGYRSEIASGKMKFNSNQRQVLAAVLGKIFKDDTMRYEMCQWLTGDASTKKMSPDCVMAMCAWLNAKDFNDKPDETVTKEAMSAHTAALESSGQMKMEV